MLGDERLKPSVFRELRGTKPALAGPTLELTQVGLGHAAPVQVKRFPVDRVHLGPAGGVLGHAPPCPQLIVEIMVDLALEAVLCGWGLAYLSHLASLGIPVASMVENW